VTALILRLSQIDKSSTAIVGGKADSLAKMAANGLRVPKSLCLTTPAFDKFLDTTGIGNKIFMEYFRKRFEDMRWEEIWDLSLKIKNMFLSTSFPSEMYSELVSGIEKSFKNKAVVVRSSSISEDSAKFSFAGIHESYVNIKGTESILKHIKLVWASLFSDAAILYRKEIGLDIRSSKMAVIIQEFINSDKSGVAFSKSPDSDSNMMIEAVFGLNQGLVDGIIEPDRWLVNRSNGRIISYTPSSKNSLVAADTSGIKTIKVSKTLVHKATLTDTQVSAIYELCKKVEGIFGVAQDTEWTFRKRTLFCLQSRPITSAFEDSDDQRTWHLSLKRSLDNLKQLRTEIEQQLIPEMQDIAKSMETLDLSLLSDQDLSEELAQRNIVFEKWRDIYWEKFIPFAHAVRLFGEIYNKQMLPVDPYEFTRLLVSTRMKSLERNRMLQQLAKSYHSQARVDKKQTKSTRGITPVLDKQLDSFIEKFRNPMWGLDSGSKYKHAILQLLKEMACPAHKKPASLRRDSKGLCQSFINSFPKAERADAEKLLDLARTSYQLRDDDNIYLGRIEGQVYTAVEESARRLGSRLKTKYQSLNIEEAILALKDPKYQPRMRQDKVTKTTTFTIRPRQLTGQAASEGLARGRARIIREPQDTFEFKAGEILVCDAIDPNMTFIVPLAAGIVERRGGMLIHGAIIAREYGIPCITGVPNAVDLIENGHEILVDGYLGIVTIEKKAARSIKSENTKSLKKK
jgi:pyruvate,water dikinase